MSARGTAGGSNGGARESGLKGTLRDALAAATASLTSPPLAREAREANVTDHAATAAPVNDATATASAPPDVPAAAPPVPQLPTLEPELARDPAPTRIVRPAKPPRSDAASLTRRVRGKPNAEPVAFHQDPVVGWLVVVGGPGLGAFRPIFEGNNAVGRAATQRIALDFGDDGISAEAQAYIRYDAADRAFLLVPNMSKTNIVAVNEKKPTSAVPLAAMDLITMGRTQLCFIPFCGPEFDWAELTDGPA